MCTAWLCGCRLFGILFTVGTAMLIGAFVVFHDVTDLSGCPDLPCHIGFTAELWQAEWPRTHRTMLDHLNSIASTAASFAVWAARMTGLVSVD